MEFEEIAGKTIEESIEDECSGELKEGYLAVGKLDVHLHVCVYKSWMQILCYAYWILNSTIDIIFKVYPTLDIYIIFTTFNKL